MVALEFQDTGISELLSIFLYPYIDVEYNISAPMLQRSDRSRALRQ